MKKLLHWVGLGAVWISSAALAQPPEACDPVGILSGEGFAHMVCAGVPVSLPRGATAADLRCLENDQVIELKGQSTVDPAICNSTAFRRGTRPCGSGRCFNPRQPAPAEAELTVLTPEPISFSVRPTIQWRPVAGASRYEVSIQGSSLTLTAEVDTPQLEFPADWDALEVGQAYEIRIVARDNLGQILAATKTVVNVLASTASFPPK
jgi:hypothetical protein